MTSLPIQRSMVMTIFFFFPAQVILSIRILQLWVIDTYIICLIMIVIIKISLWIFFYLSILRVKTREWRDDYANTCFSLQIGLKRIRFHCMINLTWPINVQITILDIQIMFRFSRNINSNLFQLTSDFLFHSCFPCFRCRNTVWKET